MQLQSSQRALRREESTEGRWNLEEEEKSSDIITWLGANLLIVGSLGQPVLIRTGMKNLCFVSEVHTTILESVTMSLNLRLTKVFKFFMLLKVKALSSPFV